MMIELTLNGVCLNLYGGYRLAAAEKDCTQSIEIDHTYVKSFHRRGTCRLALKKYQLARQDFLKVLEMDPNNKQAMVELEKINEVRLSLSVQEFF